MRALVLAGGSGTRLEPWTPLLPKPLAPVGTRPVLSWVLDHLDTATGVDEVGVIVRDAEVDLYAAIIGTRTGAERPIHWLSEPEPLGTGGALRYQHDYLQGEPGLVVPADILCPVDLDVLIAHHNRAGRPAATVAVTARDLTLWDGDLILPADSE